MLIVSELVEAMEELRKGHSPRHTYENLNRPGKPEGFGVELADAVIRLCDLAQRYSIDLTDLIRRKHAYNLTRPYKHGKAF